MLLIFQILICVVMVILGGFFAGSETGIYRLSRFRLRLGMEKKHYSYTLLGKMMDDSGGLVFSMLIGTNLVHYIVTSIVTVIFLGLSKSEHAAQLYATVLMAPVLFVFSEVIPKNIYYYRADVLMPRFAVILWFFHKLCNWSGVVGLLKLISRMFVRLLGASADGPAAITTPGPNLMKQIIRETHDEGILSSVQNDIMNRLVNIPNITLSSVMVPINKTQMLELKTPRPDVMEKLEKYNITRLPIYETRRSNIIGFVNIYEVLGSGVNFQNLRDFVKPIGRSNAACSVIDAINRMRNQNHKIVLVTSAYSGGRKPLGIVTMKDLVEEFTGELAEW